MEIEWNSPSLTPTVKEGTEQEYWVAVKSTRDEPYVFMALYQNRPLELHEDGDPINDDYLSDTNGDPISSIGWVDCKQHYEFDDFYEPIQFNDNYKLLGWADYVPPKFTEIDE